jgi:hypothetical protein
MKRYKINSQEIIWQMIEGECILLNLSNGNYFSLDNLGVLIWQSVIHSLSAEQLMNALRDHLPEEGGGIADSVEGVLEALQQEGLIIPSDDSSADMAGFMSQMNSMVSEGKVIVKSAKLHAYKNIQEKYAHPCGVKEI